MCQVGCKCQRHTPRFNLAKSEYRYTQFRQRRHLVVPVVLARSSVVMNGSVLPEDEMLPETWNGVPVTVGHPNEDNNFLSANAPSTLEQWAVGHIFNAHVKDGDLRGEAWIDVQWANEVAPGLIAELTGNKNIDVSTGYFCQEDAISGELNGQAYQAIARAIRPDHLALLPNEAGACSWEDGCGVRANRRQAMAGKDNAGNDTMPGGDAITVVTPMINAADVQAIVDKSVAAALAAHKPVLNAEDQAAIDHAKTIVANEKKSLIDQITARTNMKAADLDTMSSAALRMILDGLPDPQPDYTGRAIGKGNSGEKDERAESMQQTGIVHALRNRKA